jgi:hypothetical protein
VREWYSIEAIGLSERMLGAERAVGVELLFKQGIDSRVEVKRKPGWACNS